MKKILMSILLTALITFVSIHAEETTISTTADITAADVTATAASDAVSAVTLIPSTGTGSIIDWLNKNRQARAQGISTPKTSTNWGSYVSTRREVSKGKPLATSVGGLRRISCNDTDNLTYSTKGYVTGYNIKDGNFKFEDTCLRKDTLKEWYCHKDAPKTANVLCSKVGKKFTCNDGACVGRGNTAACSNRREYCGGITGKRCCLGYTCKLDGNYPDAQGTCVAETVSAVSII